MKIVSCFIQLSVFAEVNDVYEIIKSIDNQAFVNIVKTNAVKGRFYQEPID